MKTTIKTPAKEAVALHPVVRRIEGMVYSAGWKYQRTHLTKTCMSNPHWPLNHKWRWWNWGWEDAKSTPVYSPNSERSDAGCSLP